MSSSKKLACKETLRQVFFYLRPETLCSPPYTQCIRVYSILIHTGKGGELNQREGLEGVIKPSSYNDVFINIILSIVFINALLSIKS